MNTLRIKDVPSLEIYGGSIVFRPDHDKEDQVTTSHHLVFPWLNEDGTESETACLAFPCESNGFIDLGSLCEPALVNLKAVLETGVAHGQRYGLGRIETRQSRCTYRERSWLLCECGKPVHLCGFTNTCDCGADYNMNGSLLAPRSQWGEETGESISDILRADCAPNGED